MPFHGRAQMCPRHPTGFETETAAQMLGRKGELLWQALAVIAVTCLVFITLTVVRREFLLTGPVIITQVADIGSRQPSQPVGVPEPEPPVAVSDWQRVAGKGHRIGPADAPVTLVVFSDFECPFCARFATDALPALEQEFGGNMAVLFRHWPLQGHEWAYPAARAAECAAAQDRFREFHDAVFRSRSLLGKQSFHEFARTAGVRDLAAFERCATASDPVASIGEDVEEARRTGGRGTPTIVINGLRLRPPYSTAIIADHVRDALEAAVAGGKE
jgi:protein-disulfide isomerase